jgi:sulfoxide reductase heme-binding subunit YedZ
MPLLEKLLRSKATIVALIVLPGLWPAWPILQGNPTVMADPLKYVLHHLGFMACILLVSALALTPLRVCLPRFRLVLVLNRHRRLLGVSAFAYAALHLTSHILYEGGPGILASDVQKPFLLTGLLAFSILLVLASTSFDAAVRRLGSRRWKLLHRLAYVAAGLVAYHQSAARKIFPTQVLWIFVPLAVLELARIVLQRRPARLEPLPPVPAAD